MEIKFEDIREEILQALKEKLESNPIKNENGFAIIEGFIPLDIKKKITNKLSYGGANIPAVGLVGNNSGRIYMFALKAILPDIKI